MAEVEENRRRDEPDILKNPRAAILRALQEIDHRSDITDFAAAFGLMGAYLKNMDAPYRDQAMIDAIQRATHRIIARQAQLLSSDPEQSDSRRTTRS